jgi:hypothetical protein
MWHWDGGGESRDEFHHRIAAVGELKIGVTGAVGEKVLRETRLEEETLTDGLLGGVAGVGQEWKRERDERARNGKEAV